MAGEHGPNGAAQAGDGSSKKRVGSGKRGRVRQVFGVDRRPDQFGESDHLGVRTAHWATASPTKIDRRTGRADQARAACSRAAGSGRTPRRFGSGRPDPAPRNRSGRPMGSTEIPGRLGGASAVVAAR